MTVIVQVQVVIETVGQSSHIATHGHRRCGGNESGRRWRRAVEMMMIQLMVLLMVVIVMIVVVIVVRAGVSCISHSSSS